MQGGQNIWEHVEPVTKLNKDISYKCTKFVLKKAKPSYMWRV